MQHKDIYSFIGEQERAFRLPISVTSNWEWGVVEHINKAVLYKNSTFITGKHDNKPFKNIVRPILNLQYRAEGFDVKDIVLFVDNVYKSFKSFLIRKFHDKWARKVKLDTFIDKLVESYVDFGIALVKKTKQDIPEVVPLQRLAFCDQTNLLSGPIAEKHFYSPEELRAEANKGWEYINEVIALSEPYKEVDNSYSKEVPTPSKYIEVYEVHGVFPRYWLYDLNEKGQYIGNYYDPLSNDMELVRQVHICTFYKNKSGQATGLTLFKGPERELPYKAVLRDEIYGRAFGLGGVEELEEPQVWANYGAIRLKELLDAASKVVYKTTDPSFANRNKTQGFSQGEILILEDGKDIGQIDTTPRSSVLFDNYIASWEQLARQMGAANESILGESPTAGTPFKLQELITAESHSLHEYRKGKLATFLQEIYEDWIIPKIVADINKGQEFLAELDADEMIEIANGVARCAVNRAIREGIKKGTRFTPELVQQFQEEVKQKFMSTGSKQFIEALQGELKDAPVSVEINIAGKQKDLAGKVDKLVNVLRFMLSTYNPQTQQFAVFQDPRMSKLFRQILEASGLSSIDFGSSYSPPAPQIPPSVSATKPLQGLAQRPSIAQQVI